MKITCQYCKAENTIDNCVQQGWSDEMPDIVTLCKKCFHDVIWSQKVLTVEQLLLKNLWVDLRLHDYPEDTLA